MKTVGCLDSYRGGTIATVTLTTSRTGTADCQLVTLSSGRDGWQVKPQTQFMAGCMGSCRRGGTANAVWWQGAWVATEKAVLQTWQRTAEASTATRSQEAWHWVAVMAAIASCNNTGG